MKKFLALILLGAGFASTVISSDYNNRENEPGYGQTCNVGTPSPKHSPNPSPRNSPKNDDSNDKK
jgi:hypothetical protein